MDVFLTGVLAVLQLVLGGMGVYVALKPPKSEHHIRWIASFITVGLIGVWLTVWITHRADSAQQRLNSEITGMRVEEARMSGELIGIRTVMENLSKTGIPGLKDFAQTIVGLVQSSSRRGTEETKLSRKQLCERATVLSQKIKTFQSEYDKKEMETSTQEWRETAGKARDEMIAIGQRQMQERLDRMNKHELDFRIRYMSDAKYIHDQIMDRLSLEQRDTLTSHNGQAESNLSWSMMAGAFNEQVIATYLDELAKALCSM